MYPTKVGCESDICTILAYNLAISTIYSVLYIFPWSSFQDLANLRPDHLLSLSIYKWKKIRVSILVAKVPRKTLDFFFNFLNNMHYKLVIMTPDDQALNRKTIESQIL